MFDGRGHLFNGAGDLQGFVIAAGGVGLHLLAGQGDLVGRLVDGFLAVVDLAYRLVKVGQHPVEAALEQDDFVAARLFAAGVKMIPQVAVADFFQAIGNVRQGPDGAVKEETEHDKQGDDSHQGQAGQQPLQLADAANVILAVTDAVYRPRAATGTAKGDAGGPGRSIRVQGDRPLLPGEHGIHRAVAIGLGQCLPGKLAVGNELSLGGARGAVDQADITLLTDIDGQQVCVEVIHDPVNRQADIENGHHPATVVLDRAVLGHIAATKQGGFTCVGLAADQLLVAGVTCAQQGADCTLAVVFFQRGGDAQEVIPHAGKHRGIAACHPGKLIDLVKVERNGLAVMADHRALVLADSHLLVGINRQSLGGELLEDRRQQVGVAEDLLVGGVQLRGQYLNLGILRLLGGFNQGGFDLLFNNQDQHQHDKRNQQ